MADYRRKGGSGGESCQGGIEKLQTPAFFALVYYTMMVVLVGQQQCINSFFVAGCCRSKYRVPIHYLKNSGSYTTNQSSYVRNVSINSRGFFCVCPAIFAPLTWNIRIIYVLMRRCRGYLPKSGAKYQVIGFTKKTIINLLKWKQKMGHQRLTLNCFMALSLFLGGT